MKKKMIVLVLAVVLGVCGSLAQVNDMVLVAGDEDMPVYIGD